METCKTAIPHDGRPTRQADASCSRSPRSGWPARRQGSEARPRAPQAWKPGLGSRKQVGGLSEHLGVILETADDVGDLLERAAGHGGQAIGLAFQQARRGMGSNSDTRFVVSENFSATVSRSVSTAPSVVVAETTSKSRCCSGRARRSGRRRFHGENVRTLPARGRITVRDAIAATRLEFSDRNWATPVIVAAVMRSAASRPRSARPAIVGCARSSISFDSSADRAARMELSSRVRSSSVARIVS